MLTPLIFLSALTFFSWLYVPATWRHETGPSSRVRNRGFFVSSRRSILPATTSLNLFMAAAWLLYASSSGRGANAGIWRYAIGSLILSGLGFTVCCISIFLFDRPRSMIPPSMRPGHARPFHAPGEEVHIGKHTGKNDIALRPDERVIGDFFTNHVQGDRAYGGHLFITTRRVIFNPVAASKANGGASAAIDLKDIYAADVAPRRLNPSGGAWRRRLRITTFSGNPEYLVVWRPRKLADLLNSLLSSRRR